MRQYRYERKYFLNAHTAAILRSRAAAVMRPDAHTGGVYTIHNLYLDDQRDSFYLDKLLGSMRREKYRVRYYNGDLSFIRLERKVKDGLLSYKESAKLTAGQYDMIRGGDFSFTLDSGDPLLERLGVLHKLRLLRPAVEFTYRREAYVYKPGNVRVTFDSRIGQNIPGLTLDGGAPPGPGGMLEVKYDRFLPEIIAKILSGVPLIWTDMSKYGYVYEYERGIRPNARHDLGSHHQQYASREP